MVRTVLILAALAAAACGSVDDRGECAASAECPVGQYCARTADGNVCWGDDAAPVVTDVSASCADAGGCRRDSVLRVTATVSDATSGVLDASVALDLPGGPAVPMARSGAQWAAEVDLRQFPFDHFERNVVATVTARDEARNTSAGASAAAVNVTRLRWVHDAGVPMTSPAVMDDGTIVVGLSATSGQLLAVTPGGAEKWALSVGGSAFVTAAPAIGEHAIWAASENFSLYGARLDGSALLPGVAVNAGGAIRGAVAVLPGVGKEWGFAASAAGRVAAASTGGDPSTFSSATEAIGVGPVIGSTGRINVATSVASATVRAYSFDGAFAEKWSAPVGVSVFAPIAIDAAGAIWTGTQDAKLTKVVPSDASGSATTIATLPSAIVDSPVIISTGDVLIGDQAGSLHRYTASGASVWATENLGGAVLAPIAMTGTDARFLVSTKSGSIHAISDGGIVVWSAVLDGTTELRSGNIHGDETSAISTAYFSAANGKLFAVVVDGQLDASAPWPKAFHDPKNTNRAGPRP